MLNGTSNTLAIAIIPALPNDLNVYMTKINRTEQNLTEVDETKVEGVVLYWTWIGKIMVVVCPSVKLVSRII